MAKKRIYEIARKLNVSSGEVMDLLRERGMGNLTASSGVDDSVAEYVEKRLKGQAGSQRAGTTGMAASAEKGTAGETTEERKAVRSVNLEEGKKKEQSLGRSEEGTAGRNASPSGAVKRPESADKSSGEASTNPEKKKSRITRVYNPQNMSNPQNRGGAPRRDGRGRPAGERPAGRTQPEGRVFLPDGERRANGQEPGRQRPEGERRPAQAARPEGERRPAQAARPEGERRPAGTVRPEGERRPAGTVRPEGERRPAGTVRPESERRPDTQGQPERKTALDAAGQGGAVAVENVPKQAEKPAEKVLQEAAKRPAEERNRPAQIQPAQNQSGAEVHVRAEESNSETEDIRENMDTKKENEKIDRSGQISQEEGERDRRENAGARREGQMRDAGERQSRDVAGRDQRNREGGRQARDGQSRDGNRQARDGQNRDGNRRNADGAGRDGNRRPSDGANRDTNRRPQDGQERSGYRDGNRRSPDGVSRDGNRRPQDGSNRDGFNRRGADGQGTGGAGRSYRDGQERSGRSFSGTRDGAGRDGSRQGQGGFRRDGGAGRDGGFGKDGAGQNQGGFRKDAGRRRSGDSAMRGEGFKEDAAFRQGKNDRKNRQERNKQDNKERSFHQEKTIKTPVKQQAKLKEAPEEKIKMLVLPETISIKELAEKMSVQPSALLKKLLLAGTIVNLNQEIDYEMAEQIALEYDIICEKEEKVDVIAELLKEEEEDESLLQKRPPVVCVMGHVDHGKTSLLDAIRKTNVIAHEAGGITQHIGAYTVEIDGRQITFLDTPGHEAFTAMRMRGAQATDIAILVVAADDGVMPQTIEAINHAKAANISIIVAINKIDKPGANVERVKQELTEHGLVAESWGGSTIMVPVSAHTGEGIEELLEMVLLDADINELKANPERKARGIVIEAKLDKGRGPVMTVLVQKGTLHVGENVAVGEHYGKVRSMINDKGRRVESAGPSVPVEIAGMNGVPNAGEIFIAMDNEKDARTFAETFIAEGKKKLIEGTKAKMSLDDLYSQIKAGDVKELDIVVKADVQGSVEAVRQSLEKLSNDEVVVKVIHGGVGAINESDVTLASASNAIVIGFNVKPDNQAKDIAQAEHVDLRLYSVIYNAIADVELAMKGMLDPIFEEKVIGHGEVRQTFKASGVGTIAGSYVLDGIFRRGCKCRITRGGEQIFDGEMASLKRFKDDAKEVRAGYECGCVFEKFNDLQEGDQIEAYDMVEVPRT